MSFDFNNWQGWFRKDDNTGNQGQPNRPGYYDDRRSGYNQQPNGQPNNTPGQKRTVVEEFQATGQTVVEQVQKLIHEGNVRRIRIKKNGRVILDIPVVAAVVGGILAPALAALGGIAAVITNCTIEVTRDETAPVVRRPTDNTDKNEDASFR
jgi:hypothetical protein